MFDKKKIVFHGNLWPAHSSSDGTLCTPEYNNQGKLVTLCSILKWNRGPSPSLLWKYWAVHYKTSSVMAVFSTTINSCLYTHVHSCLRMCLTRPSVSTYSVLMLPTVQQSAVHLQKAVNSAVFLYGNQSLTHSTLLLYWNTRWTLDNWNNLHISSR